MDPTVTIRNRSTGEVRQVPLTQLSSYGGAQASGSQSTQASAFAPPAPAAPQGSGGGFEDYLPLIGALGGSFIPGIGPILGGALGAGIGTIGKQAVKGKADPGEIVKEAALAGAGGVVGKGASSILEKFLPKALTSVGEGAIGSQYNVPRNVARAINFPDSVQTLADKYGITDLAQIPGHADTVTGANGVVSQITRRAVAGAKPVELGEYATANGSVPSVLQMAQDAVADPSISAGTEKKFMNFMEKGIQQTLGGEKGTITGLGNPEEVYGLIQKLEDSARGVTRGRAPTAITSEDKALAGAYRNMADELKSRLFGNSGADQALTQGAILPEHLSTLEAIHPQLAQDVANAKTVGELRGVAAPFVQANQAAAETNAASQFGFKNLAGTAKGAGKMIPSLTNPLAPIEGILSSPGVNAKIGSGALKGAKALRNLPLPSTSAFERTGASAAVGLGSSPSQPTPTPQLPDQTQAPTPTDNLPTRDPGRTLLGVYALKNARNVGDLVTAYNLLNPKPANGTVDRAASIKVGENVVDKAMSSLTGYGPLQGRIYQFQLSKGGGAGVPPEVVKTNTAFNLLRQSVVRALQGARMSDADIKIAEGYTPSLTDTPETVQQKLGVLKQILGETRQYLQSTNQQYYSPTQTTGSTSLGF